MHSTNRSLFATDHLWNQSDSSMPTLLLSGTILMKQIDQWAPTDLELRLERLYKHSNQYCELGRCRLKKFSFFDPNMPLYKYGMKLNMHPYQEVFLLDSPEKFKKWFTLLKRYCILDNFRQKFRVLSQAKYRHCLLGYSYFNCIQNTNFRMVQIIEKKNLSQELISILTKEISCLRQLNHQSLMYFNELYEDEDFLYISFNHYQGISARVWLLENPCLPQEKLIAQIMYNLLQGVSHMHSRGIFHRNIHLDTIYILESLPQVVLVNFCYSEKYIPQTMYKKCGTPGFIAPEIFKYKNYTPKVDIFSLGVVMYSLCFGKMPFYSERQEDTLARNKACIIDYDQAKIHRVSSSCLNLMKGLLNQDPEQRLSATQALQHHWFIKMGAKIQQSKMVRGKSLSTIIENSMDITHSFQYRTPSIIDDTVEKEFTTDSLNEKLSKINSLQLKPSKQRHIQ